MKCSVNAAHSVARAGRATLKWINDNDRILLMQGALVPVLEQMYFQLVFHLVTQHVSMEQGTR